MNSEWYMGVGALLGYEQVNAKASDIWYSIYGTTNLTIALTDTFTTDIFFKVCCIAILSWIYPQSSN